MTKKDVRILVQTLLLLGLLGAIFYVGRRNHPIAENSGFRPVMGTFAQVTVVAKDTAAARLCIDRAFAAVDHVDQTMSDYSEDSELTRLNKTAFDHEVKVSPELFAVLCAAKHYSQISGGAFDVTVGPEVQLWRTMAQTGIPPTPQQIEQARAKVGYDKLILNPETQTVQFEQEGMRLDLGGIAKGYAIDLAAEAIMQHGALGGMVDIGGDIRCFGLDPSGGSEWIIGLQNPRKETIISKLKLVDYAVATSGDYRRYAETKGKKQSHILNPATAASADELISVSILAPTAIEADALATAVSVMGRKRGLELIESLDGVEAFVIAAEYPSRLIETPGAASFLVK